MVVQTVNNFETVTATVIRQKGNKMKKRFDVRKEGSKYVAEPIGNIGKGFGFVRSDAEKCGGKYIKYNADTEKGGWFEFSSKKKAEEFVALREESLKAFTEEKKAEKEKNKNSKNSSGKGFSDEQITRLADLIADKVADKVYDRIVAAGKSNGKKKK